MEKTSRLIDGQVHRHQSSKTTSSWNSKIYCQWKTAKSDPLTMEIFLFGIYSIRPGPSLHGHVHYLCGRVHTRLLKFETLASDLFSWGFPIITCYFNIPWTMFFFPMFSKVIYKLTKYKNSCSSFRTLTGSHRLLTQSIHTVWKHTVCIIRAYGKLKF